MEKKITVPSRNRIYALPIDNIVRFESCDTNTALFLEDGEMIMSSKQLRYYEEILLADNSFFRIHRSHIINTNFLDSFLTRGFVKLKNNELLPVGESKKMVFVNYLKKVDLLAKVIVRGKI